MSRNQFSVPSDPGRTIRKVLLSAFVVISFAAYAAYERLIGASPASAASAGDSSSASSSDAGGFSTSAQSGKSVAAPPGSSAASASAYKDGTFQGQAIDAYYGLVQVQVSIQGGSIQSVQFLQYPNDRRTSVQINSIAMPYLQQEAVQAQSANVNIISGATLTSEGFQMSLQSALQAAHN